MSVSRLTISVVLFVVVCISVFPVLYRVGDATQVLANRPHLRNRTARFYERAGVAASIRPHSGEVERV
jgi:hypothetical protein